jgi:hypothetical protein
MITEPDCANARRVQGWMAALAAEGEVAALRRLLRESGEGIQVWSLRHRRDLALAQSAAAAAARHGK